MRLEQADGYAQIIVSDTGKGISADFCHSCLITSAKQIAPLREILVD